MNISISLILIAAGAILNWAITSSASGVNLHAVGWILMIIGIIGLVISFVLLGSDPERPRRWYIF